MDGTVLTSCDTLTGAVFSIVSWPTEIRLDPTGATPRMAEPVTMMSLSATDWLPWGGGAMVALSCASAGWPATIAAARSEEHTSELQSIMRNSYAVFCLKKKKTEL